jgi:hypothetical protein
VPALLLGIILVCMLGCVIAGYLVWHPINRYLVNREVRRIAMLQQCQRRLQVLVGELLKRADDLDQESKFLEENVLDQSWHDELALVCCDLVALGDAVKEVDILIREKQVKIVRRSLIRSTDMASRIADRLRSMKRSSRLADTKRVQG